MNFLMAIIDGIVSFVRRNPLLCLILFVLAVAAPSVLKGIAVFILYFFLGLILLVLIFAFSFRWRIYNMHKQMKEQMKSQSGFRTPYQQPEETVKEGEVKVYATRETGEKRVNKHVGDYVEFEDVEDKDTK
ncbi:MAG: DUF4834 domain-containing protein [Alistipes sp.]